MEAESWNLGVQGGGSRVPRSWNQALVAPRPGNVDLYNKMISKMNLFGRGGRILEFKGPGR